ncbi:hypothetical protein CNMCM7691_000525 [Aspergillus felis]|uniref:Uncharacterized protein n=1 Tax=Aspergillus felis TaxID=1287682 RepID=A0A8H6QZY1_9EURO|nr:hypothetical protein CNMCM7691_000525 [Aspergillus felis]
MTLTKTLSFAEEHQEAWWKDIAPIIAKLLIVAEYDIHEQYKHLLFLHQVILPILGPYAQLGSPYVASVIPNGLPFEASLNFQRGKQTLRFGAEPTNSLSWTAADPFNQIPTYELVSRLGHKEDPTLYHAFRLSLSPQSETAVFPGSTNGQHMVAWDLNHMSHGPMKMYWFPAAQAKLTGVQIGKLVLDAIGRVPALRPESLAYKMVESYLSDEQLFDNVQVLAWDCLQPEVARVKIYISDPVSTFERTVQHWTLGGRVQSRSSVQGIEMLRHLWTCLDLPWNVPSSDNSGGIGFNWEFLPGSDEPEPKVYVVVLDKSDLEVTQGLVRFFHYLGWNKLADSHLEEICSTL